MTPEEAHLVHKLTARMRTRCIGRHLIDLPEDFVLNPVDRVEIEGVEVSIRPLPRAGFDYQLERRTEELKRETIHGEKTQSLREIRQLPDGRGVVFDRSKTGANPAIRTWELRAWLDGYQLVMTTESYDKSLSKRPLAELKTDVEEKYTHLLNVYRRLRGRRDEEIPGEPGDCFAHGLWTGAQAEAAEFYVNYHLKDAPDVFVQVSSISGDGNVARPDTGLMQRKSQIERDSRRSGIDILRFSARAIGKDGYEEYVAREPEKVTSARVAGHTAIVQTDQSVQGVERPFLTIEFYNGHYIPSPPRSLEEKAKIPDLTRATLSEGQVLALWEAITATLRPRPGAL
ncbi:MAG: T6SS immunity protein Tli4 family protein [Caldimonas sp.]|uniref:T6SS immunity protein Tli4 family protein n=1 Tax=Caldimonas sp. TaxID=2838790 RepID=UPI00391B5793